MLSGRCQGDQTPRGRQGKCHSLSAFEGLVFLVPLLPPNCNLERVPCGCFLAQRGWLSQRLQMELLCASFTLPGVYIWPGEVRCQPCRHPNGAAHAPICRQKHRLDGSNSTKVLTLRAALNRLLKCMSLVTQQSMGFASRPFDALPIEGVHTR